MLRAHPTLLADMRLALLSELGAEAAYRSLARSTSDPELVEVLRAMQGEQTDQVARLRRVMIELGARPRRRSLRRRLAARVLAVTSRVAGARFALRVCQDAEETVARWYRAYANHLVRAGELEAARACEALREVKERHSQVLSAWVELIPR